MSLCYGTNLLMLNQRFDASVEEQKIFKAWEDAECFAPNKDQGAEPYSIVIPPPNVTGVLHMGHALNNTLQDVLVRFERMRGKKVLWQVGTDHAGIATQMVVERNFIKAGGNETRASLGRDEFVKRVWEWRHQSGGEIINQLKRLGSSCDWSREKFTMGENGSDTDQMVKAVKKVFVELYNRGLIYRAKRLVNWDTHFRTAISDLEVVNEDVSGHMWHFKYPLCEGETYTYIERDEEGNITCEEERDYISIATTRPETMLGDGAVAVHPEDDRYKPIIGKFCEIPVGPKEYRRQIPIITDEYPDPSFGSGAVKITGAHDFNDYQVAKRGKIPMYSLMDDQGAMRGDGPPYAETATKACRIAKGELEWDEISIMAMNLVPDEYRGLDRYLARKRIINDITAEGLAVMVKEEDRVIPLVESKIISQPVGDRSGTVIEPMLKDQWFVDAKTLAIPAIQAVQDGKTQFIPQTWSKTYFNWLEDIQPWCISRQLWWGHRIPAWFCPNISDLQSNDSDPFASPIIFVGEEVDETESKIAEYFQENFARDVRFFDESSDARAFWDNNKGASDPLPIYRDPDVLDTWFSSALWPFSTQGWPDDTEDYRTFYPTNVLVTAFDIIFFWVARMMMMGLHFTNQVPFKDVYIHALVLDENGQKMSKSKGNAIDPLELVDQFGADALRFALTSMAAQGRNIRLSTKRVEGCRNFSTKLWNAAKFCQQNSCVFDTQSIEQNIITKSVSYWIVSELALASKKTTEAIESYKFNEASDAIHKFVWNVFCDWYLELIKSIFANGDNDEKTETRRVAGWVFQEILKLMHPFMPFVTESLWQNLTQSTYLAENFLMLEQWTDFNRFKKSEEANKELEWVIEAVSIIRSYRADLGIPQGVKIPATLIDTDNVRTDAWLKYKDVFERIAKITSFETTDVVPAGSVSVIAGFATIALRVEGVINLRDVEKRLEKEITNLNKNLIAFNKKLADKKFLDRAPVEVVEENRQRIDVATHRLKKLNSALTAIKGI